MQNWRQDKLKYFKNSEVNPSGPGALLSLSLSIAIITSFKDKGLFKTSLCSSDIIGEAKMGKKLQIVLQRVALEVYNCM